MGQNTLNDEITHLSTGHELPTSLYNKLEQAAYYEEKEVLDPFEEGISYAVSELLLAKTEDFYTTCEELLDMALTTVTEVIETITVDAGGTTAETPSSTSTPASLPAEEAMQDYDLDGETIPELDLWYRKVTGVIQGWHTMSRQEKIAAKAKHIATAEKEQRDLTDEEMLEELNELNTPVVNSYTYS